MCGIAGVVGEPHVEAVRRMVSTMRHRGPDDHDVVEKKGVTVGMSRLAILDLSEGGHQPMSTADGRFTIVYNGEMYNFREEKKGLEAKGHMFRSTCDTEVVLHLYQEYGDDCMYYMRGMFAFAVWDAWERRLFAARDHLGIKPFLYSTTGGQLIFASELKALLASGLVSKQVDHDGLYQCLLLGYLLPPVTMVESVRALAPGQYLTWEQGELTVETYWDIGQQLSLAQNGVSYVESRTQIRSQVLGAVKEQLVSDVPLGVFLSGGLDSAVVIAAMANAAVGPIEGFTLGFDQAGEDLDETEAAAATARHFGAHYHKLVVTGRDVARQFDDFVAGLDQPSVDGLNTYLVSQFARKEVTVALSGLGGDELFAGYSWASRIAGEQASPSLWRSWLAWGMELPVARVLPGRLWRRLRVEADKCEVLSSYALSTNIFSPDQATDLLNPELTDSRWVNDRLAGHLAQYDDPTLADPISRVARLDLKTFMAGRLLRDMDAVGMAHSLEVRFPLIDHRLEDYAFSLPASYKFTKETVHEGRGALTYSQGGIKRILFDAFASDLPPGLGQRGKSGFSMPFERWLRTDLATRVKAVLTGGDIVPLFRPEGLRRLWLGWQARSVGWSQVWIVLVLDAWYRRVLMQSEAASS